MGEDSGSSREVDSLGERGKGSDAGGLEGGETREDEGWGAGGSARKEEEVEGVLVPLLELADNYHYSPVPREKPREPVSGDNDSGGSRISCGRAGMVMFECCALKFRICILFLLLFYLLLDFWKLKLRLSIWVWRGLNLQGELGIMLWEEENEKL